MAEPENALMELLKDIWDEFKNIPNSGQSLSAKMNAAFGIIAAGVIAVLFVSTFLREAASVIEALHGKEVGETDMWIVLWAFLTLVGYFVFCVLVTRPRRRGGPRTRGA